MRIVLERFGAVLVFLGILATTVWGSPPSRVDPGIYGIGEIVDEKQNKKHNRLLWVGPIVSGAGCLCYLVAAFL